MSALITQTKGPALMKDLALPPVYLLERKMTEKKPHVMTRVLLDTQDLVRVLPSESIIMLP